jgi:hypothetical protein
MLHGHGSNLGNLTSEPYAINYISPGGTSDDKCRERDLVRAAPLHISNDLRNMTDFSYRTSAPMKVVMPLFFLRCESSSIFFWRSLWAEKSLEIIKEKNT